MPLSICEFFEHRRSKNHILHMGVQKLAPVFSTFIVGYGCKSAREMSTKFDEGVLSSL